MAVIEKNIRKESIEMDELVWNQIIDSHLQWMIGDMLADDKLVSGFNRRHTPFTAFKVTQLKSLFFRFQIFLSIQYIDVLRERETYYLHQICMDAHMVCRISFLDFY